MSTLPANPALTYEVERGKPLPSLNHSIVEARLGCEFGKQTYFVFMELTLDLGQDRILVPDLSIFASLAVDFRHDEVKVSAPPKPWSKSSHPSRPVRK